MLRPIVLCVAAWLAGCAHAAPINKPGPTTTPTPVEAVQRMPTISSAPHDPSQPQPRIARPTTALTIKAPADAIVLFDGSSLQNWRASNGGAARWKVANGYVEVVPGAGDIQTIGTWGDAQLHVEWAAPLTATADEAHRGDSGILMMGRYEVQVFDSYGNDTYADGEAAAIYGQYPPLVNASLPPGEWQSFDIIFHRPRFENGRAVKPASITVFYNGVLVQDNVELVGPTSEGQRSLYTAHADRLPISLQDHGQPVRFRNIWIRDLGGSD